MYKRQGLHNMKIIMLGAPGAGKGTQAKKIAEKYAIPHISTGDIFRANIKNGTELGQKAKGYMDQGLLVPDELVVDLVADRVKQDDCKNGYVLDLSLIHISQVPMGRHPIRVKYSKERRCQVRWVTSRLLYRIWKL